MIFAAIVLYIITIPFASAIYLYKSKDNSIFVYADNHIKNIIHANYSVKANNIEYLTLLEEHYQKDDYVARDAIFNGLKKKDPQTDYACNKDRILSHIREAKKTNFEKFDRYCKQKYFIYMTLFSVFWLPVLMCVIAKLSFGLLRKLIIVLFACFRGICIKTWDVKDYIAEKTREKKSVPILKEAPSYRKLPERASVLVDNL